MDPHSLKLIKITRSNIDALNDISFNENIMRYITGKELTREEAISRYSFGLEHKYFGTYFVKSTESNQFVGLAVIKNKGEEAEIGYMVFESFQGMGLATEINRILIEICREKLSSYKLIAMVDSRNVASIRVLEKSGMKREKRIVVGKNKVFRYVL